MYRFFQIIHFFKSIFYIFPKNLWQHPWIRYKILDPDPIYLIHNNAFKLRESLLKSRDLEPVSIQRPTVAVGAPLSSLATRIPLPSTVTWSRDKFTLANNNKNMCGRLTNNSSWRKPFKNHTTDCGKKYNAVWGIRICPRFGSKLISWITWFLPKDTGTKKCDLST